MPRKYCIYRFLCLCIVSASSLAAHCQTKPAVPTPPPNKKIIQIRKAVDMYQVETSPLIYLVDSVVLYHDGATMYCDSAQIDLNANSFQAFGRIYVNQGDTLFMYGQRMNYNGMNKLLEIRQNVRLENDKDMVLFTDSLNYDRIANIAYYFDGGMLVDRENELTSDWGQYQPALKLATFRDSVHLVNDKFTLTSNLLKYNTDTKIASIVEKSVIVSDSGYIETTHGWYNTVDDQMSLLDRSIVFNNDGNRTLTGDSIYYDKKTGFGEAFGNMQLQDTLKRAILRGNYGFYNELTDFALATDSAYCIEYSKGDSLYVHADSLFLVTDSLVKDDHTIFAYHNVRIFRSDVQGVCDSLLSHSRDSVLYLYRDAVLWNENNQISGDTIEAFLNNETVDSAYVKRDCFAVQQIDSLYFNQLKGRTMKLYFTEKDLRYVLVDGNAESLFYPQEKDSTMSGTQVQSTSSLISFYLKDKKMQRISLWSGDKSEKTAVVTPFKDLSAENKNLPGFRWLMSVRPKDRDDIFRQTLASAASQALPKAQSTEVESAAPVISPLPAGELQEMIEEKQD